MTMTPQLIVAGNGSTPSQSDLQQLSDSGHLVRGGSVRAVLGKPWSSEDEARWFLMALVQAQRAQIGINVKADIQIVALLGKEFAVITSTMDQADAARLRNRSTRRANKPWWQFWK